MWLWLSGCVFVVGGVVTESVPRTPEWSFDEPVSAVVVDLDDGDVRVRGGAASTTVAATLLGSAAELDARVEAGTLYVDGLCPKYRLGPCVTDVELWVPAEVDLSVESGTGSVDAEDVVGTVLLDLGTGDVELEAPTVVEVEARSGTGSMAVGLGGVRVAVLLETGTGDLELAVPAGAYAITTESGTGSVDVDEALVDDAGAPVSLVAVTGTGDVRLTAD